MAFSTKPSAFQARLSKDSLMYSGVFCGNLQGEEFTEYFDKQQMLQEDAKGRSKSMTWAESPSRGVFRAMARRKTVASSQPATKSPCAKHALALGQQRCSEQAMTRIILNCSVEDFRNFKASLKRTGVLTSMGASQVLHTPLQSHILAKPCQPRGRSAEITHKATFSAAA